ncbi:MAG TPA: GntR family transcriptional regulator, partial [Magnetospirillum sp.]|nr:GntR family transcriptional regulator [Magnetospirillum sp.]
MSAIDDRLPRYQRLRDRIAADIAAQMWKPGEAIPSEAELAATHKVAVGTVRHAIDVLVADGLVVRQQGRGTFVCRPNFEHSLLRCLQIPGLEPGARAKLISRIVERAAMPAPPDVAERLALAANGECIRMVRQKWVDRQVLRAEEIWLPKARFAPMLTVELSSIGNDLYPAFERLCGQLVATASEALSVEAVGPEHAPLLGLSPGQPVVVIDRLTSGFDRQPLEWRRVR